MLHSPLQDGFWWSHVGWILSDKYSETREEAIATSPASPSSAS
jgi:stearoyl-CoA desaturase (delta-9 desaturase)